MAHADRPPRRELLDYPLRRRSRSPSPPSRDRVYRDDRDYRHPVPSTGHAPYGFRRPKSPLRPDDRDDRLLPPPAVSRQSRHIQDLQGYISNRNHKIQELESALRKRDHKVNSLAGELKAEMAKRITASKSVSTKNSELEEKVEEMEALMHVGTKCLQEKTALLERLEVEVQCLRTEIASREEEVQTWRARMDAKAHLTAQEAVDVALDVQARRTLGMLEDMRSELRAKDQALGRLKEENEGLKKDQKAEEPSKGDSWRKVAEDQQLLIQKLVAETARLGGSGKAVEGRKA